MRVKVFYLVILIFLVMSPQAFSNGKCPDSFSSNSQTHVKLDKQELERLLLYPIDSFNFSNQVGRVLAFNNIYQLADLVKFTESGLLKFSELGVTGVAEIKALLSAIDLHLGMTDTMHWSAQQWNELIEAHKSNKKLPPVLVRRVVAEREEKVLRMRYGIGEKRSHTYNEIAQSFNVSGERIRQIQNKAIIKLRLFGLGIQLKNIKPLTIENIRDSLLNKGQIKELIELQKNLPTLFPESI